MASKKDYIFMSALSKGSYTKVYKATEKDSKKVVVIKQINKSSIIRNSKIHAVFLEKLFLSHLKHPKIV